MKFVLLAALFASVFLLGCIGGSQPAAATPAPTQTITATISAEVIETPTATPAVQPAAAIATASPTATVSNAPTASVQEIKVTAKQFSFEPNPIVVKKGVPVKLFVTSTDVKHGISIPAFGVNKDLPVGEETIIEFTPDKAGSFPLFCSVFCGSGHGGMSATLQVTE